MIIIVLLFCIAVVILAFCTLMFSPYAFVDYSLLPTSDEEKLVFAVKDLYSDRAGYCRGRL